MKSETQFTMRSRALEVSSRCYKMPREMHNACMMNPIITIALNRNMLNQVMKNDFV